MSYVVGGCSTYSKLLFRNIPGYPERLYRGKGALVTDKDGREYVDWGGSLGPVILGYRHPTVEWETRTTLMYGGIVLPLPTPIEETAAELLCTMAGTEQLRWCKNGSDATEAAVRLARFVTGNGIVLTTGYHGFHSDVVTATPGKAGGILANVKAATIPVTSYDDCLTKLQSGNISCVLAEPVFADGSRWRWGEIKQACEKAGALLIFDEVITGFRYGKGPALNTCFSPVRIDPDLYCFGKAIANGMPLACVTGPRALMRHYEQDVFMSSTAAAEMLSLAACYATLTVMQREPVHKHLWEVGTELIDGCKELHLPIVGRGPRSQFRFPTEAQRDAFLSGMAQRGHLLSRDNFIMFSHTRDDVQSFLKAAEEVVSV